jgi:hypothetical protein
MAQKNHQKTTAWAQDVSKQRVSQAATQAVGVVVINCNTNKQLYSYVCHCIQGIQTPHALCGARQQTSSIVTTTDASPDAICC